MSSSKWPDKRISEDEINEYMRSIAKDRNEMESCFSGDVPVPKVKHKETATDSGESIGKTSEGSNTSIIDVKLVLIISGKDRSTSDVTEFFRAWKRDQPVWQNNTEIKFDLIDVRKRM